RLITTEIWLKNKSVGVGPVFGLEQLHGWKSLDLFCQLLHICGF
ncbi:unnamed protein product, partial [Allacma fusca]